MTLRVLLVGATGTIGRAVASALETAGHDVVRVGRTEGELRVDLADPTSIRALYASTGTIDAVVCTAGVARFGALEELDDAAFDQSIANKMMGQVNLVRFGLGPISEGGSFTLTTGTLSQRPTPATTAVAMTGGAVESFVRAAALDLAGRCRINAVSPGWVAESRVTMGLEPMPGIWASDLAEYYSACVEGSATGQVFEAEGPLPRRA
jgi:NAD(P)-dependent dehydrogenase (short-subunit alcohol dehydrogenase family)